MQPSSPIGGHWRDASVPVRPSERDEHARTPKRSLAGGFQMGWICVQAGLILL